MRWLAAERRASRFVATRQSPGDSDRAIATPRASGQYFSQQIYAGPAMVEKLALAVGVSPIDALWNARHYGAVLDYSR